MAIEKIELSDAIQSLATQSTVDSLVGSLSGEAANISAANLATVVAGKHKFRDTSYNDAMDPGNYYMQSTCTDGPLSGISMCMIVFQFSVYRVQLAFRLSTADMYIRCYLNSWSSWKLISKTSLS